MTSDAAQRREARSALLDDLFPDEAGAALDELARLDLAWQEVTGEPTPPPRVVDDVLFLSLGRLDRLRDAARLAVLDPRDLHVNADAERRARGRTVRAGSWTDPGPEARRARPTRRQALVRFVAIMAGVAVFLGTVIPLLIHRRDTGSRDRAWDAVGAYTQAVALEVENTGATPDDTRLTALFDAAVPVRSVRQQYFKADLSVAWTVVDPASGAVVACVQVRSMSAEDDYGAAWAATDPAVRRSVAGGGCGSVPASFAAAVTAARG